MEEKLKKFFLFRFTWNADGVGVKCKRLCHTPWLQGILRTFLKKVSFKVPLQYQEIFILRSSYFSCPLSSVEIEKKHEIRPCPLLRRHFEFGNIAIKRCQIFPLNRKFQFPALFSKQLIEIFCSGLRFGMHILLTMGPKSSEIKPPLTGQIREILPSIYIFSKWVSIE